MRRIDYFIQVKIYLYLYIPINIYQTIFGYILLSRGMGENPCLDCQRKEGLIGPKVCVKTLITPVNI